MGLTYQGYDNDNQVSYSVTGRGTCNDAEIIIPTTHLGYPVTRIEDNAFSGDTKLTKIVIPDFVTSIGSSAFSGCSDSIYNTKDGLKYLGNKEYLYLYLIGVTSTDITTTNIDSGCKIIGDLAFYGCANLASVSIPQGVTSIGYGAFAQCKQLTQVIIPNSVASIGNYAFDHCEGLSLVTIPNNLTKISDWAFQYCISLASVTIPNGVTSIGQKAFGYCASLTSIKIPNSVTYIGAGAFYECSGLMSMAIGNSVESIGDSTFLNCVSLTSIEIPDSVNYIGNSAFRGCSGLTSVVIPNGITSIGKYVFAECTKLGDIDIPDSVTEIGEAAFWGCSVLKSVILGRNIKTITAAAFNDTALTKVYYKNTQDNWGEVSAQGIPSGCTIYYYSEAEPLLSEDGTAYNGDYWMYQEQKGFQISCEGDYLIDSPHFKVTHEGDITAINGKFIGEIQAGDGNIGDLQISDEGLLSSSGSVQLSKDGLILCSDQPKIRVGDFTIGQNESGVTEFTASGPLVIQGMDNAGNTATSLTFMQSTDNESELNVEVAVKVECCDTSNDRPKIRAWLETYNGVKPYYAISVTLSYQWARGYTGVFGPYDVVLTLQANQTVGYSQYIEFDGNSLETERVSFMVKQGDYTWVWSDRYVVQELERMTLFTISKTQSPLSNQIGVYGHLIPQIGATDTEGFSLGAPLKYWHTIYAKTSEIDLSDMNEKNTINALSDQYSLVFDALTPVSYKFNTSTSDRLHTGFIAQDVKAAIENAGLTTQDFAAYCEWETNGETTCGLRYSEFIALCVNEIQKLKKRVAELENQTKGENNGTETTSDHS